MNANQRRLLFELVTAQPATFAELSMRTCMANEFLDFALDSLVSRGFVERDGNRYRLAVGVLDFLMNTTDGPAVNT